MHGSLLLMQRVGWRKMAQSGSNHATQAIKQRNTRAGAEAQPTVTRAAESGLHHRVTGQNNSDNTNNNDSRNKPHASERDVERGRTESKRGPRPSCWRALS